MPRKIAQAMIATMEMTTSEVDCHVLSGSSTIFERRPEVVAEKRAPGASVAMAVESSRASRLSLTGKALQLEWEA